jgi:hypothetical protein
VDARFDLTPGEPAHSCLVDGAGGREWCHEGGAETGPWLSHMVRLLAG